MSEEDFEKCHKLPEEEPADPKLEGKTPFEKYLYLLNKWGGIDTHKLTYFMKEANFNKLEDAIGFTEEALKNMQEAETKYQNQLTTLKQAASTNPAKQTSVDELEATNKDTWTKREDDISTIVKKIKDSNKEQEQSSLIDANQEILDQIEKFELNSDWKKELEKILTKVAVKKDKNSTEDLTIKKKNEEKILK